MPRVEFGADGIRGKVGEWPFLPHVIFHIGQALAQFVRRRSEHPSVVVGRDTRPSGLNYLHCLLAGLNSQGINGVDLDVMTTPGVAFLARRQLAALGVAVSASHNPIEYNGLKVIGPSGVRLQREEEIEIEGLIDQVLAEACGDDPSPGQQTDAHDLGALYIADQVACSPTGSLRGLRVVLDCADGAASRIAPEVFRRLGADMTAINDTIEGKSINWQRGSEHVRDDPSQILRVMRRQGADYGFAFDGDGDRLVVVDSDGQVFDGSDLLYVLARYFHAAGHLRGDTVVTIRQANQGLEKALGQIGVRTLYTANGDRNLEAAMWAGDYLLGGEPGGNIIINDGRHTAADAIHTAVVLGSALVCDPERPLSARAEPLQRQPQIAVSLRLPDGLSLELRQKVETHIDIWRPRLGQDSRILLWPSSTQPGVFRLMVEGSHDTTLAQAATIADNICDFVRQQTQVQARTDEISPADRHRGGSVS